MKKYLFLLLTICFIFHYERIYSQEEFLGNNDGISLGYLNGFRNNASAIGISTYFKKGMV